MERNLPKSSYKGLEMPANHIADLRSFIYLAGGLPHTMRYRASGEPEKAIENFDFSIGDRDYLVSAIIEYYMFNNKNQFSDAERKRLSELNMSYDLGDVGIIPNSGSYLHHLLLCFLIRSDSRSKQNSLNNFLLQQLR